jgi:mRNA-degrading endonuclease YafQ of YafQ-DinJ toxin-antitoxin module
MNIAFDNPRHEALVKDYGVLCKRYNKKKGVDSASDILGTLNVLNAANTLAEVPPSYRPHPLKGSYKGCFAVDVDKIHRIIFKPNPKGDPDFRIDNYRSIKNITIIAIYEDYH